MSPKLHSQNPFRIHFESILNPFWPPAFPPCYGDSHLALYFFVALLRTIVQCLKMAQVGSKMAQNHETAWHGQIFGPIFGPLWRPILPHLASSCPILRSPNPTLLWGFAPSTNICPRWLQHGQNVSQNGSKMARKWLQDRPRRPKMVPRWPSCCSR